MMIADPTSESAANSRLIEAGVRSALVTLGQMLPQGKLVLKGQDFIHSSVAAHSYLRQLRCDGVEVTLSLSGRISGTLTLALETLAARQLVAAMVGERATTSVFNEMAQSVLKEAGNVVASAFFGELESLSGSGGMPGLPELQMDNPCRDERSVGAEKRLMCALPVALITRTNEARTARGGIFISLHDDDSAPLSPVF